MERRAQSRVGSMTSRRLRLIRSSSVLAVVALTATLVILVRSGGSKPESTVSTTTPRGVSTTSSSGSTSTSTPTTQPLSTAQTMLYAMVAFTPTPHLLSGKVVGIDPGHNGKNYSAPTVINAPVFNGVSNEACDTTGTATDAGYSEAQFNFDLASYLRSDLLAEGATVVMTRSTNQGVGPCITTRATILNDAGAAVAIDIHADGGPVTGRGFAVLEPLPDGPNDSIITSSDAFGQLVVSHFLQTGMPTSTYDGVGGVAHRSDLAGLNLATEPKVLIECGNMKNPTDAAILSTPGFQQSAAAALVEAINAFLIPGG